MIGPIFSFAKRVELKSQLIQGNKSIHSFWRREEFGMVSPLRIFIMYHGKKKHNKTKLFYYIHNISDTKWWGFSPHEPIH